MINIYETLTTIMDTFSGLATIFTESIGNLITQAISIELPDWQIFDISLLQLMIGTGVVFYIGYSLVVWLVDLFP